MSDKKCPKCGSLAVLFADYDKNDQDSLGLRCAKRCGWQETMADLRRQLVAKTTELSAWHKVFGTSQLTHASARLEQAEAKVNSLEDGVQTWEKRIVEVESENEELRAAIATPEVYAGVISKVVELERDRLVDEVKRLRKLAICSSNEGMRFYYKYAYEQEQVKYGQLQSIIDKLPVDISQPDRPVLMTDRWGKVDLGEYVLLDRREYDQMQKEQNVGSQGVSTDELVQAEEARERIDRANAYDDEDRDRAEDELIYETIDDRRFREDYEMEQEAMAAEDYEER